MAAVGRKVAKARVPEARVVKAAMPRRVASIEKAMVLVNLNCMREQIFFGYFEATSLAALGTFGAKLFL
jgi:hypothetical protein